MIIAAALSFWYYYVKTKKELGGITGDTAGYFVCICECAMAVALGGVSFIIQYICFEYRNGTDKNFDKSCTMNFKLWNWRKYEACDRRSGTGKA